MAERVAIVTGGTGALGGTVVTALLMDGWAVWVPWVSESEADHLRSRSGDAPALHLEAADLTDATSMEALVAGIDTTHRRLDLLCNLVGGFAAADVAETEPATWKRMWDLNATAPFLAVRAAVPLMRRTGGGSIVNVAAAAAVAGPKAGMSAYLAAKSAVVSLTRNLAAELAGDRITVNALAPTIIDTPANRSAMPEASRRRWLDPAEIADVVRFLAGPTARVVSGNVLTLTK
jgi:NAD(P)-dependent dehydrogenase (short-subunit alcohol dehydrogenase family)